MKKYINLLTKLIIVILFLFTWRTVQNSTLREAYIFTYLALVVISLLSDRYFFQGQESQGNKEHEITSHYISLTWFRLLIISLLEHAYLTRYNIVLTISGAILVIAGITIRGIGIRTLGEYFSRDVETWENQKIIKTGIYNHIRHPAYTGNILQAIGYPLILNSYYTLILSAITIAGFLWRIKVEEKHLSKKIPEYKDYMKETKKLIPKIW